MSNTLLLISDRENDLEFAKQVASTAELSFQQTASPQEAGKIISEDGASIVLVDASTQAQYQAFEAAIQESVGLFSDKVSANTLHFISTEDIGSAKYLIQSPLFGHFILRNYIDPIKSGTYYGRIVAATLDERAFGLAKLMKPGTKVQVVKLKESSQKNQAVEAIKNLLVSAKFQTRMATVIASAVDELLMNAMFDAPVDETGRQKYASISRSTVIPLVGPEAVEMHVGYDGEIIAISVIDGLGSLDKAKLLEHIAKIYVTEEYKIKTNKAGAGIGLGQVFRRGASLFFVSESRVRTEVTLFFHKTEKFRDFREQFRFFSTQFYF